LTIPLVAESRPGTCLAAPQAPPFSVATNPWDFPAASVKDPPPAQLPAEAQDTDWTSAWAPPPAIAATAPDTPLADPQCPAGALAANAAAPVATASAQQADKTARHRPTMIRSLPGRLFSHGGHGPRSGPPRLAASVGAWSGTALTRR
jgi:hypothetical protein